MFGDLDKNPKNWRTLPVESILQTEPQNGLYRHSSDYGSGTQILRIDGFYDGYLSTDREMKRVAIDQRTIETYALRHGDIVINRVNSPEYLGKCALIEGLCEPTVFESNMMRFRVDSEIANPRFIVDQFRSGYMKRQIARAAKPAVNQSSINQKDVKSFEVRLPSTDLQSRYAKIVAAKDRADIRLQSGRSMAGDLLASLSQRAFCGEL
jgi:type I restriction enzyme S subunit